LQADLTPQLAALADPVRRAMLAQISKGGADVSEPARPVPTVVREFLDLTAADAQPAGIYAFSDQQVAERVAGGG
jgi:hypothetical protein